jgi:ABC-type multidrug transport system ATPase subunit
MQRVQTMLNEYRNLAQDYYEKLSQKFQDTYSIDKITIRLLENDIIVYPKNLFEKVNKDFSVKNFKPFGAKAQKVSKKPITLIYGPNSIGKSSYLRSLLYLQAIKQTGEIDIKNSSIIW